MSKSSFPACAAIVLAAGASKRMGYPKQLLDFQGKPLLRHAAETAIAAGCGKVVVVLGAEAQRLQLILDGIDVETAINERWAEGMGTSIQAGLRALGDRQFDGAILALADQPFVTTEFLSTLIAEHYATGKSIVAARYSGTVGVPVFFARDTFPKLLALPASQGCKGVILDSLDNALLLDCPAALMDVDTPQDYADMRKFIHARDGAVRDEA